MAKRASVFKHLRDILILPFSVTVIVPYILYNPQDNRIPESLFLKALGVSIGLCGVALFFYTVFLFKTIAKATLAPWSEKQKLVVVGPYRYCRNPMISGVLFVLIGETLFFSSVSLFVWTIFFFLLNTAYFILSEEPGLTKRFGEEYLSYKKVVPRWIPRLKPFIQA
jgi:protein-S-isoprenylcysteine O-methyltransferase Ste14